MKNAWILTAALLMTLMTPKPAEAITLKDIAGRYRITHPQIPVVNLVRIGADGRVDLVESSPYGKLECSGAGQLAGIFFTSELKCKDGRSYTQRINIGRVTQLRRFSAPVFSSIYGQEVEMNFERI